MDLDLINEHYIKKLDELIKKIYNLDINLLYFENSILEFHQLNNDFGYKLGILKLNNYNIDLNLINDKIFEIFKKYYLNNYKIEKNKMDTQSLFYIELLYKIYFNHGYFLDKILFEKFKYYENKIKNFTEIILENILKFRSNEIYNNTIYNCKNRKIRYDTMINQSLMLNKNKKFVIELLNYKNKKSKILGYNNYTDFILKDNMSNNYNNVMSFLNNIKNKLKPNLLLEINILKNEALKDNITDFDERDIFFYINKLNIKDVNSINFNLTNILNGIFDIYEKLLDYNFIEISNKKIYKVINNNIIIGYLYLDLIKNKKKYTISELEVLVNKTDKLIPICLIKCNFNNINNILFEDLIILFHEFGHFIQIISTNNKFDFNSSFNTDFIEVSSQLFEEFCFNKKILQFMTNDFINDEYIDFIKKLKYQFINIEMANQLIISYVDIMMHYNTNLDIDILYNELYKEIFGFNNITNPIYLIDHIYEGYDCRYYSYLWSYFYSKKIYTNIFENKELDKNIFTDFKNNFLLQMDYTDPLILYNEYLKI